MDTTRLARRYLVVLVGSILLFTVAYDAGMSAFEGRPRTFLESLEVVMQTFTTTGYGQDAPWDSAEMTLLVVTMQVGSLLLIFSAFPAVIVPLIEESLSTTPPAAREDLSEHVVVCRFTTHTASLIDEFESLDTPYVILEPDREAATDLYEREFDVVHGDPESIADLGRVNAAEARALVSDAADEVDMSVITSAREIDADLSVYSIAEDPEFARYHELAGADRVFRPRELLGTGLANKVRNTVDTSLDGPATVGEDFDIAEIPVEADSDLAGARLADADVRDRLGNNVIGVWSRGRFHTPPYGDLILENRSVLLVIGRDVALDAIARLAGSEVREYGRGQVVIAGAGVVGRQVSDALDRDGIDRTVIDLEDGPGVDVVGDATEEAVLDRAGVRNARTVVLALDDDTVTLVASFVIGEFASEVEIVARADETENVPKLYRAGADYVLALSTVAGRLLAAAILESEGTIEIDERIRLVRRAPGDLAGVALDEAAIRERTGCTVVALERRDGRVTTDPHGGREIGTTDRLVVAGTDAALGRLADLL